MNGSRTHDVAGAIALAGIGIAATAWDLLGASRRPGRRYIVRR